MSRHAEDEFLTTFIWERKDKYSFHEESVQFLGFLWVCSRKQGAGNFSPQKYLFIQLLNVE